MSSGPFNMAPGDTQEVVYAQTAFGGEDEIDRLDAVAFLKYYSKYVYQIYNGNGCFECVGTNVIISSFTDDREIVLYWGDDVENIKQVENGNSYYGFEGYNVYQVPGENSTIEDGIKIITYDLKNGKKILYNESLDTSTNQLITKPVYFGTDSGIDRFINISENYFDEQSLNNGTNYYYIVEAYYYAKDELLPVKTVSSKSQVIKVMPQSPNPGIIYPCEFGESLSITQISGSGEADVDIMVIDPSQLTGHEYEITFHESTGQLLWNLEDITSSEIKLTDQTNITGTDEYYIVDGFRIIITQDTCQPETCLLTTDDVFTFTTPGVVEDEELAKTDVDKINVFPNPYYGGHGNELNQYHNYVMFNHLPKHAKFRIFNLAGHLVRTLEKDDDSQFYAWDLQNEDRLQAPSGLYIIYIEMPELQKVKVLKLAIVQRGVIPESF